jgi:hypothetical protein
MEQRASSFKRGINELQGAPAIFVLACLAMVVNEMIRNGATALAGVAVIAAGIPVYFLFGRRK